MVEACSEKSVIQRSLGSVLPLTPTRCKRFLFSSMTIDNNKAIYYTSSTHIGRVLIGHSGAVGDRIQSIQRRDPSTKTLKMTWLNYAKSTTCTCPWVVNPRLYRESTTSGIFVIGAKA